MASFADALADNEFWHRGINATYVWPSFPNDDTCYFSVETELDDGGAYVTINRYADDTYGLNVARWCGFGDIWDSRFVEGFNCALEAWAKAYAILGNELDVDNADGMPEWAYVDCDDLDEEAIFI